MAKEGDAQMKVLVHQHQIERGTQRQKWEAGASTTPSDKHNKWTTCLQGKTKTDQQHFLKWQSIKKKEMLSLLINQTGRGQKKGAKQLNLYIKKLI